MIPRRKRIATLGLGGWASARPLILFLMLAALVFPAMSLGSNVGWSEAGNPIMCNGAHNGIAVQVDGSTYRCGWHQDRIVSGGYYVQGWGWVGICPSFTPYYGNCWAWRQ